MKLTFAGVCAALFLALLGSQTPIISAHAVDGVPQKSVTVTRPYVHNWTFRSTKLKRCAFIEVTGAVVGTRRYAYRMPDDPTKWDPRWLVWTHIKLKNPSVRVQGWPILGAGCNSLKRWKVKADITQAWQEQNCDVSVSIGAGFPWFVSANPSFTCGKERVGHTTSTEGPAKTVNQFNTGYPVRFGSILAASTDAIPFSANLVVRVHTKTSSDLFRSNKATAYLKR